MFPLLGSGKGDFLVVGVYEINLPNRFGDGSEESLMSMNSRMDI